MVSMVVVRTTGVTGVSGGLLVMVMVYGLLSVPTFPSVMRTTLALNSWTPVDSGGAGVKVQTLPKRPVVTVALPNSMPLPKILTSWSSVRAVLTVPDSLGVVSRVAPPLSMVAAGWTLSSSTVVMVTVWRTSPSPLPPPPQAPKPNNIKMSNSSRHRRIIHISFELLVSVHSPADEWARSVCNKVGSLRA